MATSSTVTCSSCGEVGHRDARNKGCKNRSGRAKRGREEVTGESRGLGSQPSTRRIKKFFHQTWMKQATPAPSLVSTKEAEELCKIDPKARDHIKSITDQLGAIFQEEGISTEALTEADLFLLLLGDAPGKLVNWMNIKRNVDESLGLKDSPRVKEWELESFMAYFIFLSLTGAPKKIGYELLTLYVTRELSSMRGLLSLERYEELQQLLCGFRPFSEATSTAHKDVTDKAKLFSELDSMLGKASSRILLNPHIRITIDDRNLGTVSKSKPLNTYRPRKRHKNGAGSDACACSSTRCLVFQRLYDRSYSQKQVLEEMLKEISSTLGDDVSGVEVVLDRGYPSIELYQMCARLGFDLLVINDLEEQQGNPFLSSSAYKEKPRKYENRGWDADHDLLRVDSKFIVEDGPEFGQEILTAKKSLTKGSQRTVEAHAFAVREYGNHKAAKVTRFVSMLGSNPGLEEKLKSTYVYEPHPRLTQSVAENFLFYPSQQRDEDFICEFSDSDDDSNDDAAEEYDERDNNSDDDIMCCDDEEEKVQEDGANTRKTKKVRRKKVRRERLSNLESSGDDSSGNSSGGDSSGGDSSGGDSSGGTRKAKKVRRKKRRRERLSNLESSGDDSSCGDSSGGTRKTKKVRRKKVRRERLSNLESSGDDSSGGDSSGGDSSSGDSSDEDMPADIVDYNLLSGIDDGLNSREQIETILRERIVPLTCGQRCADWFVLRRFLVTGTTGHEIASDDPAARKILFGDATRGNEELHDMRSKASALFKSWFHVKKPFGSKANRAIITGNLNESAITAQLREMAWVDAIFEIGLVRSRRAGHEHLGCSADNIALIRHPSSHEKILLPVEMKTKATKRTIDIITKVATEHGSFIECVAGDKLWKRVVPTEYRSQVLQQAVVFESRYGLLCMATKKAISYCVLIEYPATVHKIWVKALEPASHLITWASDAYEGGNRPVIPVYFSSEQKAVIKSHLPMWFALLDLLEKSDDTMLPIRGFRSLVQVYYSKGKQGVDGLDDYHEYFDSRAFNLPWEKKVLLHRIIDLAINAGILWRLFHTSRTDKPWRGVKDFLNRCSRFQSIQTVSYSLVKSLMRHAGNKAFHGSAANPEPTPQLTPEENAPVAPTFGEILTEEEAGKSRKLLGNRNVIKKANMLDVQRLRLSGNEHAEVDCAFKNGTCRLCGERAKKKCSFCGVVLHVKLRNSTNQRTTCWNQWHTNLQVKRRELPPKSK